MWFRNLQIYRLGVEWKWDATRLTEKLAHAAFRGCGAFDMQSRGWVPPRGEEGELVVTVNRQWLIALGVEQKLLPATVIRQYTQARVAELEAQQGFKAGRAQARDLREQVTAELLPRAFVKRRLVYAWIDPVNRWLVIDAASPAKAEDVLEQLKLTLDDLPLKLLRTRNAPGTAMTGWLAGNEAPAGFTIDRDCELRAAGEEKAVVRYVRHALDGEEIGRHIAAGKAVTRLAMTWRDRISFVLTEQLQVKRLAFLDVLKEDAERQAEAGDDLFEADFALMSGELAQLMADLAAALDGEAE
ncbi:MAG TPA: recombination-associated protein RdgC [Rhodocyclaceae bacterium]|nr:recombination-associated protein RdgC [Rhodocyclaceae bacterium]